MLKRISFLAAIVCGSFFAFGAQSAFAVNELCDSATGSPGTGLCTINTTHTVAGGAFTIDRNTLITGTGKSISIMVDNGDVDLQTGSIVRSDGKSGGAIFITNSNTPAHTMDLDGT